MSKKVKSLLLVLCAVVFLVAGVFATLAYLEDTTEVIDNTMTVGDVNITLDESEVTYDKYYRETVGARQEEGEGNAYNLIPGKKYTKDPEVHVLAKSEPSYVFVKIDNQIAAIEEKNTTGTTIAEQMSAKGWVEVNTTNFPSLTESYAGLYIYNGDKCDFDGEPATKVEYIVNAKEDGKLDLSVFDSFTVEDSINNLGEGEPDPNLANYQGKSVKVQAFAIQAIGVEVDQAIELAADAFEF